MLLLLNLLIKLLDHLLVPLHLRCGVIASVLNEFALFNESIILIKQRNKVLGSESSELLNNCGDSLVVFDVMFAGVVLESLELGETLGSGQLVD